MCFAFVDRLDNVDVMTGYKNEQIVDTSATEHGITSEINNTMSLVSKSLAASVRRAGQESRLVGGLLQSAQLLDKNADDVMFCVLPSNACDDLTLNLHITLVEAFCWENEIPLVKVENMDKLAKLTGETESSSCLLVQMPETNSEDDDAVLEFLQETYDCAPQPVLSV